MLTIRPDQMARLALAATSDFEQRAVRHLHSCLPEPPGDAALLDSVRAAIVKAAGYGIHNEVAVLRYLNAMYLLGPDFDTDPALPWAGELLRDRDFESTVKMSILTDLIARHLQDEPANG